MYVECVNILGIFKIFDVKNIACLMGQFTMNDDITPFEYFKILIFCVK